MYNFGMQTDDIKKLATLARIDMTESEMEDLKKDFDSILGYIDQIRSVDVPESDFVSDVRNIGRVDEATPFAGRENIIKQFPDNDGDALKVPSVL